MFRKRMYQNLHGLKYTSESFMLGLSSKSMLLSDVTCRVMHLTKESFLMSPDLVTMATTSPSLSSTRYSAEANSIFGTEEMKYTVYDIHNLLMCVDNSSHINVDLSEVRITHLTFLFVITDNIYNLTLSMI